MSETIRKAWIWLAWILMAIISLPLMLTAIFAPDPHTKNAMWFTAVLLWPATVFLVYRFGLIIARKTLLGRLVGKLIGA